MVKQQIISSDIEEEYSIEDVNKSIIDFGDNIRLEIGSLVKINSKYSYSNIYRITKIITFADARKSTYLYYKNRDMIDSYEYLNESINILIEQVNTGKEKEEIKQYIQQLIDKANQENEDILSNDLKELLIIFEDEDSLFEIDRPFDKKNTIKKLKTSIKKGKKYKNFNMLLNNLSSFPDETILVELIKDNDKKSKPFWYLAEYIVLLINNQEIDLRYRLRERKIN